MKTNILIVDADKTYTDKLQAKLENTQDLKCKVINNYDYILKIKFLDDYGIFFVRFDILNHSFIEKLLIRDKIVVLLTDNDDGETKKQIKFHNPSDYIVLNENSNGEVALRLANRLINNSNLNVMVVNDYQKNLDTTSKILKLQNLNYITYTSAKQAWEHLNNPEAAKVDLVITDNEMPEMDGYDLTKLIRTKYPMQQLPILVCSESNNTYISAKFLKAGANDYIAKPYTDEEFIARVSNTLTMLDMFHKIESMTMTDYLTGLNNRSYFYQVANQLLYVTKRAAGSLSLCMLDVDEFKFLNDNYGHYVGDKILVHIADTIKKTLRKSDVFVRYAGSKFIILLTHCTHQQACDTMDKVTALIATTPLVLANGEQVNMTISSGVNAQMDNLDTMVSRSASFMKKAKENGQNQMYSEA